MTAADLYTIVAGCIVNPLALDHLDIQPRAAVVFSQQTGCIVAMETFTGPTNGAEDNPEFARGLGRLVNAYGGPDHTTVIRLSGTQFLLPGFIDTHTHASQFANMGTGYDMPLLQWLDRYTFPEEAKFADSDYAGRVYDAAVAQFVQCGTTTAVYFGTIHTNSCCRLVDIVRRRGQRAWVGKVNMDRNAPEYYIETTERSVQETERFIDYVSEVSRDAAVTSPPLLTAVITPRFVGSCSSALMRALSKLAQRHQLPVQSHLCENQAEVAWTLAMHPECTTYAGIYQEHGLLATQTILAHCVHPSPGELALLANHQVGIAHCPNSNFMLQSGVANVRQMLRHNLAVGLGTDVSGGSSPSLLDAMRQALVASRTLAGLQATKPSPAESQDDCRSPAAAPPLGLAEVVYLATMGGAQALGWARHLGNFAVGKAFDALICSTVPNASLVEDCMKPSTWQTRLEQFVYLADDRHIDRVYVQGNCIHQRS
ncbi:hypothetical protein H4R34_000223 [Dimargaris verticillata]|uniref:Guanine deaminase n=1 Tax=Dimargaris verticillata TaxID=2761393 RepID=A0A9W8EFM0_9FUNG|nr:hypothetical protein H4R34_000223 [Dimargaris verticillata]